MKYIFIDFEMNPMEHSYKEEREICWMEIIEFGAVMLDEDYKEISHFKEYVRPVYSKRVTANITSLTGISMEQLSGKDHFEDVFRRFVSWCLSYGMDVEVYAWSESDLKQLTKEMKLKQVALDEDAEYILAHWNDFQKEYDTLVKADSQFSLERALNSVGISFAGKIHDALFDARNTAELFTVTRDEEEFFKLYHYVKKNTSKGPKKTSTYSMGEIIDFGAFAEWLADDE